MCLSFEAKDWDQVLPDVLGGQETFNQRRSWKANAVLKHLKQTPFLLIFCINKSENLYIDSILSLSISKFIYLLYLSRFLLTSRIYTSIHPSIHPSVRPSVRPSIHPSLCLSVHLSVCIACTYKSKWDLWSYGELICLCINLYTYKSV